MELVDNTNISDPFLSHILIADSINLEYSIGIDGALVAGAVDFKSTVVFFDRIDFWVQGNGHSDTYPTTGMI